jgi:hypothetical protein
VTKLAQTAGSPIQSNVIAFLQSIKDYAPNSSRVA